MKKVDKLLGFQVSTKAITLSADPHETVVGSLLIALTTVVHYSTKAFWQ